MNNIELAKEIVEVITADLRDRKGLGDEYDSISKDIKIDIQNWWFEAVKEILDRGRE